jgi:RimJ/RimL family protein N-acetyltransferase
MQKPHLGIYLKPLVNDDAKRLWYLMFNEQNPQWKKWDAPYFPLEYVALEKFVDTFISNNKDSKSNNRQGIWFDDILIGTVSYYWEHEPSNWLEVGITIYQVKYWQKGYGKKALEQWIDYLFSTLPLVRVGLTTWSGNTKMMKLAEKLGMKQEACLRKCRLWQGQYYDSIRYGILREEWAKRQTI